MDNKTGLKRKHFRRIIAGILIMANIVVITGLAGCKAKAGNTPDDNYRVYYEVFVYSFCDSNGDGIGDIEGVRQKLDYIEDLGCTGIWLMPVMPGTTYHKYDVTDYMNIDPEYGTVDDFAALVQSAHKKGMRIIIDMVMNHTSSSHPWFQSACEYLASLPEGEKPDSSKCPYIDYYCFSEKQESASWYRVGNTKYYYEGEFWEEMPDLNLKNPAVMEEFEKIADFWMNMGVDGFRMDAPLHFEESDAKQNESILNEYYTYCKSKNPDFYMVSEVWANENTIADYYNSKTPSMFNFDLADAEGKIIKAARGTYKASKIAEAMMMYENDFAEGNPEYIDAPFITNHDMGRVANALKSNEADVKFAGGLLMVMRGSPFIYYGEEIGMKSKGTKDENKRLPFVWSSVDSKGMTKGPADADEGIEQTFPSADEQKDNPDSILNYYKNAIYVRNAYPEIARGKTEILAEANDGSIVVIKRTYQDNEAVIVINTGETATITVPGQVKIVGQMLTNLSEEAVCEGTNLYIPAKGIVVLK